MYAKTEFFSVFLTESSSFGTAFDPCLTLSLKWYSKNAVSAKGKFLQYLFDMIDF